MRFSATKRGERIEGGAMRISVASGKGGTGKTMVAVNLALSVPDTLLLDCDVEEPDAHLFIRPDWSESRAVTVLVPEVNEGRCDACGRCAEVCAFHAIAVAGGKVRIFPELCHGCGACAYFCHTGALSETEREIGTVERGSRKGLDFVHGCSRIGHVLTPAVIGRVLESADPLRVTVIDSPPGTACSMVAAVKDCDFCILVAEPTPFGLHDLKLAVEAVRRMNVPAGVVVNRFGLGNRDVEIFCESEGIAVLMRIPFRKEIAAAAAEGIPLVEKYPEYRRHFDALFQNVCGRIREERQKIGSAGRTIP